jgi:hypothetical protein
LESIAIRIVSVFKGRGRREGLNASKLVGLAK